MLSQVTSYLSQCSNEPLYVMMVSTRGVLFMLKWLLLIAILFYRLHDPFRGSALRLSNSTLYAFFVYYGITIGTLILCVVSVFIENAERGPFDASSLRIILSSVTFLNIWIFIIFLVCLFIYKLVQVYNFADQHGEGLIALITKISLLFFSSTFCYLLTTLYLIVVVAVLGLTSTHWLFALRILALIEGCTNFLSVLLTFGHFNAYYERLCGWFDLKCSRFWERCIGEPDIAKTLKRWTRDVDQVNSASEIEMK